MLRKEWKGNWCVHVMSIFRQLLLSKKKKKKKKTRTTYNVVATSDVQLQPQPPASVHKFLCKLISGSYSHEK